MIKLCGMQRRQDIEAANNALPDYIGMILSGGYRRTVTKETAVSLVSLLDSRIRSVGVFVDEPADYVIDYALCCQLDVIQLHGHEDAAYVSLLKAGLKDAGRAETAIWKAARVKSGDDIISALDTKADCLVLDSYVAGTAGGTGKTADWELIKQTMDSLYGQKPADDAARIPFFLAGGINADNLAQALEISSDIDLSGGIETDGFKDAGKIAAVMDIYRKNHKYY